MVLARQRRRAKRWVNVMTFSLLISRARYLALALPLFALFSSIQGGCTTGNVGYGYGYGALGSSSGSSGSTCLTYYASSYYGGYTSYVSCYGR
jgi:hypothetical protein